MKLPHIKIVTLFLLVPAILACTAPKGYGESRPYKRTVERYIIPEVTLIDQNGKRVHLNKILESDKPVVVDFIFGTCTTICPVLSAGYANIQQKIGPDTKKIRLISISIDPENDSPKVMLEYLKRYRAKPGWDFLTGSRADIDKVMRAFNAYIPNKMSHYPLTLIRMPSDGSWARIFGLMSSSEFLNECYKAGLK
jgi:protein SCO1/2